MFQLFRYGRSWYSVTTGLLSVNAGQVFIKCEPYFSTDPHLRPRQFCAFNTLWLDFTTQNSTLLVTKRKPHYITDTNYSMDSLDHAIFNRLYWNIILVYVIRVGISRSILSLYDTTVYRLEYFLLEIMAWWKNPKNNELQLLWWWYYL